VKKNAPETTIIMVTNATIDEATYRKLFDIGVDDIILKPYSPDKILAHVKKGLGQRDLILKKLELETESLLDPATRQIRQFIFSSIFFKKCLRQELKKAKRHHHTFSLILIQIYSKEIGGDRLDHLLRELAKILRRSIREEDIVGRENGNFGILLPETDQVGTQALSERLSNLIQNHPVFKDDEIGRSFIQALSFQLFTYPDNFLIPESLRSVAEQINDGDRSNH